MGANSSKTPAGDSSQPVYVWKSDAPITFSHSLSEKLETSKESDATRAKALEAQIQARVKAELERLRAEEKAAFDKVAEKLSAAPAEEPSAGDKLRALSREVVQDEVSALRSKLEARKQLALVDEGVDTARSEVIRCLRDNDRRPLDCWKEVETFRREVKRLEDNWVDKVIN